MGVGSGDGVAGVSDGTGSGVGGGVGVEIGACTAQLSVRTANRAIDITMTCLNFIFEPDNPAR